MYRRNNIVLQIKILVSARKVYFTNPYAKFGKCRKNADKLKGKVEYLMMAERLKNFINF
jgi:hypothetical protein